jgi:hypothetical protein
MMIFSSLATRMQTIYASQIHPFTNIRSMFDGTAALWFENDWFTPSRGAVPLPRSWLLKTEASYGFYVTSPRIMFSSSPDLPFTPNFLIGAVDSFHPDNFLQCTISSPFGTGEDIVSRMKHKISVDFAESSASIFSVLAHLDYQFMMALQIFLIAKAFSLDMVDMPRTNREAIAWLLQKVIAAAEQLDPRKYNILRVKDNIGMLVHPQYVGFLEETFERNTYKGKPLEFRSNDNHIPVIVNADMEENVYGNVDGGPYFTLGRLVCLALQEFGMYEKLGPRNSFRGAFKEVQIASPSFLHDIYLSKKNPGTPIRILRGKIDVVLLLDRGNKGYNEKMIHLSTVIVAARGSTRLNKGDNPPLTVKAAKEYLWGASRDSDGGDIRAQMSRMSHECAMFFQLSPSLAFYNMSGASVGWRLTKIVTKPFTKTFDGAGAVGKHGEDMFFQQIGGADCREEDDNSPHVSDEEPEHDVRYDPAADVRF